MRFDQTWQLSASPADLRGRAVDVATRRAALLTDGSRGVQVTSAQDDGVVLIRIARRVATGAKGAAAAVVGRSLPLVQTEQWASADAGGLVTALLRITFVGRPITLVGRIEIAPTAAGSAHRIVGRVDARIPAVGLLLERRIVSHMMADLGRQLLAGS